MKVANCVALTLIVIGAINWGLIGFFGFDLVTSIFGGNLFWISRVIFALVGIAGLYSIGFYAMVAQDGQTMMTNAHK